MDWALAPFRKYNAFGGRARRKEFWLFHLLFTIVSVVAGMIDGALGLATMILGVWGPLTLLAMLVFLSPSLAVSARRLHDIDRSAWWLLLGLAPTLAVVGMGQGIALAGLVSLIGLVLIVFFVLDGTTGPNRFGPDPKTAAG